LAVPLGVSNVKLFADSELLVKQITGLSNVRNAGLKLLHVRAKELIAKIGRVEVQYCGQ
jgi:hypothetical protein